MWTFRRSEPSWRDRAIRLRSMITGLRLRPASQQLVAPKPADRWTCYFVYLPGGRLSDAHRFTLARLRATDRRLMVICSTPTPASFPSELAKLADALVWKGVRGFDFSAYAIGLELLARQSPGADVFFLNDSVYGPFFDLEPLLASAPWRLSGFTGYSMIENHVQSYAFQLRNVTPELVMSLRTVMPGRLVFDRYRDVVSCQESRLARVASRSMSVGALWFGDMDRSGDPSLYAAFDLVSNGFPFVKKSIFTRDPPIESRARFADLFKAHGHPHPDDARAL